MFKRLKECKTCKEIFEIIGTKPFETASFWLLLLWCLLPIYSVFERIYWVIATDNKHYRFYSIIFGYQYAMRVLGYISLYIVIFFLLGRIAVYGKSVFKKVKEEPWHFLLLATLLWGCVSTFLSENRELSFGGDELLGEGLRAYFIYGAVYVCAFIVISGKRRWTIFNLFNIITCITSVIVIVMDIFPVPDFWHKVFSSEMAAMFFHFNHTGYYINMGIVCAMGLYLYESKRLKRILYAFSIALQVYGILVNSTLGAFVGSCCALIMVLIFYIRKHAKLSWKLVTPVVILLGISVMSYCGLVPTSSNQDMKTNVEMIVQDSQAIVSSSDAANNAGHGRMTLWKQGLKMIPERPIFGYGPEQLDHAYSVKMWINRPDNEFIQHAIFMGVPAAVYYILALFWLLIVQWKRMKKLDRCVLVAAGCVIAYLVSAMFGVSAFYTTPYFYMFLGMAAGRPKLLSEENAAENGKKPVEGKAGDKKKEAAPKVVASN